MCIYTLKRTKTKKVKKISQEGCTPPPNVPKLGISVGKDTTKTNKD